MANTAMTPGSSTLSTTVKNAPLNANPSSPRLLTLPWEIRQQILQRALPSSFILCEKEVYWHLGCTDILRTCHQLHVEGTKVLYSLNPFCLVIPTSLEHHSTELFFGFWGCIHRQEFIKVDRSCEAQCIWVERCTYSKLLPGRLGMANTMLVRDWLLKIDIDADRELHQDSHGNLYGLPKAEEIQDLVNQVTETYLSQVRLLRKVTVVWVYPYRGYAAHPECVKFMEEVIKPLKGLGVPIEEIVDPDSDAESDTSGN